MRRICVVTGSRAEYGLLRSLLDAVRDDSELVLQIVATGMHLSQEFGMTCRQIEQDGFVLDARVDMLLSSDSSVATVKSIGLGVIGFADAFDRLHPDILVVLGDRFEILSAVQAALVMRIPIAHIHGGEITEGAFDESIRHAVTKMAQWHFVAAESYRQRVVQMGESPENVFNFGAPGLDQLNTIEWMDRKSLQEDLGIAWISPLFLVTYHPVTLSENSAVTAMKDLLAALESIENATIIFTYPNADTGGRQLIDCINSFVSAAPKQRYAFASLGQRRYLSLMRLCDAVIGNSSSGLTEAPALKVATVNIGDRQKGRLKAASVLDALENKESIEKAIIQALSDEYRKTLPGTVSLYGLGNVGLRIKDQLKKVELLVRKPFFNIHHGY